MSILKRNATDPLQALIDEVTVSMRQVGPGSPVYPKMLETLEKLYAIKAGNRRERVSWNTVIIVGGNLLGLGVIVAYEQRGHIWSSKAASQVIKARTPMMQP